MANMRAMALLVMHILIGLGCSSNPSDRNSSIPLVRIHLPAEPISLDPALAEDGMSLRVLANTMEGLVGYDSEDRLENRLAESYTFSPDFKRIEFKIRSNARWSDGKPVLAEEFVQGLRRSFSPSTGSKVISSLLPIRGAEKYNLGKAGVEALGVFSHDQTLVIELERPAPSIIKAFSMSPAFPIRKDQWATSKWNDLGPVTGPYVIRNHVAEHMIALEKNPHYWRENAGPDRVEYLVIPDESTAVNLFESGGLDILTRIPVTDLKRLMQKNLVIRAPFVATFFLGFNIHKPPFNNKDFRKAVSGSIHRQELVETLGTGEIPALSWIPTGIEGSYELSSLSLSPEQIFSKSISIVKKKKGFQSEISSAFNSGQINSLVMEKIQYDLKKDLQLKLKLSNMDWKSFVKTVQTNPPSIYRYAWSVPFFDPMIMLEVFTSTNPNNFARWSNPHYDHLVKKISTLPSGSERLSLIRQAQDILVIDEAVIAPVYHYVQNTAISKRVKNFRSSALGVVLARELRL